MSRPPQEALFLFASLNEKLRELQLNTSLTTEHSADGTTTTTLRMVVPGVPDDHARAARRHYNYRQGRKERKKQQSDRGSMTEKASINTHAAVLTPVVTDTRKPLPAQPLPAPPPELGAHGLGASTLGAPSPGPGKRQLGAEKESIKTPATAVLAPDVKDTRQPSPAQPLPAPLLPVESTTVEPNPVISTTRRPSPSRTNGEKKREQLTTPERERSGPVGPHARFCNNPAVIQQSRIIQEAEIEKRRLLGEVWESRFHPSCHKKDLRRQDDIIRQAKDTMEDIALANNF